MPVTQHVDPRSGDVVLLVGTMKGGFILRADGNRRVWEVGGPYFPGSAVYAMAYDARGGRHRIWAGPEQHALGRAAAVERRLRRGRWTNPEEANVKFPEGTGAALKQIWQIAPGPRGRARHALLRRRAGGALRLARRRRHVALDRRALEPSAARRTGSRAAAGCACTRSCSIPRRRNRIAHRRLDRRHVRHRRRRRDLAAVEQGRARRLPARQVSGVRPVRAQGRAGEAPARPDVPAEPLGALSQRRSRRELDRHRQRRAVRFRVPDGHPSGGSGLRVDRAARIGRVPLHARRASCASIGRAMPARAGSRWRTGCRRKAPTRRCCATRWPSTRCDPAGVYFGTRSGKVFGSADEGESWSELADGLPPVISVKAADRLMAVTFVIPGALRELAGNRARGARRGSGGPLVGGAVAASGPSVPGIRDRVMTERGDVRPHVNIFVDGENIRYVGGLDAPVRDGAEIFIVACRQRRLSGCPINFQFPTPKFFCWEFWELEVGR